MKKIVLLLSLVLTITANAQTDVKNQFIKYLTDSSKMSLYEMDPSAGFDTNDSVTVSKIDKYNRLATIQYKKPSEMDKIEKSLRHKSLAYDREVYVFEGDFVYGSSVPVSGSGKGVNSNNMNKYSKPFVAFTYYKEYDTTVLIVVQARDPKYSAF